MIAPVTSRGMARKNAVPTDQINFRLPRATIDRMERYQERHPLKPSLTNMVDVSVNEWLDRNEAALPPVQKPAKSK